MIYTKSTKLVLLAQNGRLGNRIWTYANVIAFSIEHAFCVFNPSFDAERDNFLRTDNQNIQQFGHTLFTFLSRINNKIHIYPSINLDNGYLINLDTINPEMLPQARVIFLFGLYFFAPKSLSKHFLAIRKIFTPSQVIKCKVSKSIDFAKKGADLLIGVHIRHGDYKNFCNGIMFYSICEYVQTMRCIKEQFPKQEVAFIVCSDEKQDFSEYPDLNVHYGLGGVIEDLYTLASCDYIFGPNSTFSHWASFYGSVPLHILDWKAELARGKAPITSPSVTEDFEIFSPNKFGFYAKKIVSLEEVLVT